MKMDAYLTSNTKNKIPNAENRHKSFKSEENAQKVKDVRQNNNAHVNQMSFIPVYTKKTDMCHNILKEDKDSPESRDVAYRMHSPPVGYKCLMDQNEKTPTRSFSLQMRRRSVGFEDMTSASAGYGYSLSNDKRIETGTVNSNIATGRGTVIASSMLNSENDRNFTYGELESENGCISVLNRNTQIAENENDRVLWTSRPSQQLKDKSSKRKSSLNRIDFIDISTPCSGNIQNKREACQKGNRNSSSDEGSDTVSVHKPNSEFLSGSAKRKHTSFGRFHTPRAMDRKTNEVPRHNPSTVTKSRANLLPRIPQTNPAKLRWDRRINSATALQLQKYSHSAGELELTDPSESAGCLNKVCLSAQELDSQKSTCLNFKSTTILKKCVSEKPLSLRSAASTNGSQQASQNNITDNQQIQANSNSSENIARQETVPDIHSSSPIEYANFSNDANQSTVGTKEPSILESLDLNGPLDLKHIDSKSEDESELERATVKMDGLEISVEKEENEIYISADENYSSESERRPSSILRKKSSEERRELHGILKQPSDERQSRTPPSILKHRESSEEKDVWQGADLHSILKKSTSEDESCCSGPDIRPILKVSTDDESPSGSVKPRPILKKRTSFSDECSYASFPNGELKPILKKKVLLLNSDEQPKPILKSRRKSEDVRGTMTEFIASRPRAYSADMGVKCTSRFADLEAMKESPAKQEYHDL